MDIGSFVDLDVTVDLGERTPLSTTTSEGDVHVHVKRRICIHLKLVLRG